MGRNAVLLVVSFVVGVFVVGGVAPAAAAKQKSDAAWSAAGLVSTAGVAAALGEAVTVVEDDGGFPASNGTTGHVSAARLLTQSGIQLDLILYSLSSAANAKTLFAQLSGQLRSGTSIAGAGDRSAYADGQAAILKGAQVLMVTAKPGAPLEQQLEDAKIAGQDPTGAALEYPIAAQRVAPALATAMKGRTARTSAVALPRGAADPCTMPAKSLAKLLGVGAVTTSYEQGTSAPALTCAYNVPGSGVIEITTVTDTQLKGAVSPSTVTDKFAADQQSAARRYPGVVTNTAGDGVQGFSVINDDGALVALEVAAPSHGEAVLTTLFQNPSNEKTFCKAFIKWMADRDREFPHSDVEALAFPPSQQMIDDAAKLDRCREIVGK